MSSETSAESVAVKIRGLRKSRGWTLTDVENRTHGSIKAVVMGSYERGDRTLSLKRLLELASLFGVPVTNFFNEAGVSHNCENLAPIIDLRKAAKSNLVKDPQWESLRLFLTWIAGQRGDWNGEIMSLRRSDIAILALMLHLKESEVFAWLRNQDLLIESLSQL